MSASFGRLAFWNNKMGKIDLIIIGGGPAGLTAGLYAARGMMDVTLLRSGTPVCQATTTDDIHNYPGFPGGIGGPELIQRMEEQATSFGLTILDRHVLSIIRNSGGFEVATDKGACEARTILIATGAVPRSVGVPGEKEFRGRGVSYCATCDGAFFTDTPIAVIGGGDAAVKEAIYLTRYASKVYLIHRRDTFRAEPVLVRHAAENPKIEFVLDSVVKEIHGDDLVDSVIVRNVKSGEEGRLEVEGVFVFTGIQPNSEIVTNIVQMDERGFIITDREMATSCPGIYAAGDVCRKSLRQIVTAVADGAIAVDSIEKYLSNEELRSSPASQVA